MQEGIFIYLDQNIIQYDFEKKINLSNDLKFGKSNVLKVFLTLHIIVREMTGDFD